jgi:hypothetical protein
MSFNVFDESPENQIVIKEQQQSQAKVYNPSILVGDVLTCSWLSITFCNDTTGWKEGTDIIIYGVVLDSFLEERAYAFYIPHPKIMLCGCREHVERIHTCTSGRVYWCGVRIPGWV